MPGSAARRAALAASGALVLAATLTPIPGAPAPHGPFAIAERALGDALRNALLFAPLGAALAAAGLSAARAGLTGGLLALAIELAQLALPGRAPAALDVPGAVVALWKVT